MSLHWVLVIGATILGVVAAQAGPALPPERHAPGVEAYRAHYCGACHRLAAAGTAGIFGPTHDGMAATAAERLRDPAYAGRAVTPAEYLRESIVDPSVYLTPGYLHSAHPMPAFDHLDERDLEALIGLLLAQ